ncbi:unnamed protein product [Symbiodinium necroappetens]|uniref:Uncharacterized protein n=1 Tax=Symbiodinium necroappetens TaxID=1628268 RepID=A0A812T4H7_9DINO|nr:unnamed protein product [Symbiodinium necroappetens]
MATGGCWWDRKLSRADWHNFGLVVKRTGTRLPRTRGLKGSTCGIDRYGNSQYGPLGYFNMNHNHKPMLERHDQRPRLAPTERSMWVNRDADISALGLPRSGYDRRYQAPSSHKSSPPRAPASDQDREEDSDWCRKPCIRLDYDVDMQAFRCILYVWTAPDVKFGTSQTRQERTPSASLVGASPKADGAANLGQSIFSGSVQQVLEELANVKMNSTQEPAMMSKDLLGLSDFIAGPERAVLPTLYIQKVTTEQAAGQQEQRFEAPSSVFDWGSLDQHRMVRFPTLLAGGAAGSTAPTALGADLGHSSFAQLSESFTKRLEINKFECLRENCLEIWCPAVWAQ